MADQYGSGGFRFGLLLLCICACAAGQEQPVLRVTTRLVEIHVIANDHRGQPVRDLTKDDFILKDRGKPQQIRFFSMETAGQRGRAPAEQLPPGVYTNIVQGGATPRAVTLVLFDRLNTSLRNQMYAREELLKFLSKSGPDEPIALFSLDSDLRQIWDFQASAKRRAAMAAAAGGDSSALFRTGEIPRGLEPHHDVVRPEDDLMTPAELRVKEVTTLVRVDRTLRALNWIAGYLSHFRGRKNLIWISDGFPLSIGYKTEQIMDFRPKREDFSYRVDSVAHALTDANVVVYPVDARGLFGVPMANAASDAVYGPEGTHTPYEMRSAHATMRQLADGTGGRFFSGSNLSNEDIRQAIDDAAVVYVLGYQPSDDKWDGLYRPIEVSVKRDGVKLRHRKGYYAFREEEEKVREASLMEACQSPAATSISLIGSATPVAGSCRLQIVTMVEARHVTLTAKGDRWQGNLDILIAQQDVRGNSLSFVKFSLALDLTEEQYQYGLAYGMRVVRVLEATPSATRLCVAVQDRPSGKLGTLSIPLAARNSEFE
ncbi:MAG: VWA domain-containing protein [Acidobacteriales bacterium]|nr:VWA domain-containing protein [Terriglobales bacterium]